MGRLSSRGGGGRLPGGSGVDLNTIEGLEKLAQKQEFEPPKKNKVFSALRRVGGVLNIGTAVMAGATRGAIRDDVSVTEGIAQGVKDRETFGFSNIIKEDLGIQPTSRGGKLAVGATGFLADVLFDPITYLSLGTGVGLKVGGKALTKTGTKVAQQAAKELVSAGTKRLTRAGSRISATQASKEAARRATPLVNDLLQRSFGKKGITQSASKQFLAEGVSHGTINTLRQLGPQLIDKGGIKMFGKTLVSSKAIAKTSLGKASKRLGQTEIALALKKSLGNTFIADFGKNKKLVSVIEKANRQQKQAMEGIIAANETLFKNLTDDQMSTFFDEVFKKKLEVVKRTGVIEKETIGELNKIFPELKITSPEKAKRVLDSLEDVTQKQVENIRTKVEEIVSPFFKERQALVKGGRTLESPGLQAGIPLKSLRGVDDLNRVVEGLKGQLKELRKAKGTTATLGKRKVTDLGGEITQDEARIVANRLVDFEEARIRDVVEKLQDRLLKLKGKPGGKAGKIPKLQKATAAETVIFAERLILKLQNQLTEKSQLIGKVIDARKTAKAEQKTEKLIFGDEALQKVSDQLFEGENAIVKKFAKLAGLSEEEAIKFYIPSKFADKLKVNDFAAGRNLSSPSLGFLKKFTGVENKELIRNPFEAFSRGQVEVVTARVKDRAFRSTIKSLGRGIDDITEETAKALGMKKISRKGIGGEKIEGWLPKEMVEELGKIGGKKLSPIDELAKATGFDWATGLFKGYVTSLFPGFHFRNITSNQFQNMLKIGIDAANPKLHTMAGKIVANKGLDEIIKTKKGKVFTLRQLQKQIKKESDILDRTGAFGNLEQFVGEAQQRIQRKGGIQKLNPLSRNNIALETGRRVGSAAEAQAKIVNVLSNVMQGKSVKEGIKSAEEALFNYGKLSDFEHSIMRRMIPFYTFGRKNFELQMKALTKTPGKVAGQLKAFRGLSTGLGEQITEDDLESLPEWVLEGVGLKAGVDERGSELFYSGFGLPIEEFLGRFSGDKGIVWNFTQNLMSQSNPILKFPAERATGQDFFRGKPITEIDNAQQLKLFMDMAPAPVQKQLKEMLQWKEQKTSVFVRGKKVGTRTKVTADPFALHIIRNLPSSRITGTAAFISDEEESPINKALRFFTGVKGWSIDRERQEFFRDLERKEELTRWLIRMGAVGEKDIVFKKK